MFPDSSAVERAAVNREVVGSNPTRGASFKLTGDLGPFNFGGFFVV